MIWLLLLLPAPTFSNKVGIVGHPLAHYPLFNDKSNTSSFFESKILFNEENQYDLNIAENNQTYFQNDFKFDSNSTAILVFEIIVKEKTLNNDIALLESNADAVYNEPTYLLDTNNKKRLKRYVFTKNVGWGYSQRDALASTLQQITFPIASEVTVFNSNLFFLNQKLHTDNCCEGFEDTCQGDSGGRIRIIGWGDVDTTKVRNCTWPAFWLVVCPWYGMQHCQSRAL